MEVLKKNKVIIACMAVMAVQAFYLYRQNLTLQELSKSSTDFVEKVEEINHQVEVIDSLNHELRLPKALLIKLENETNEENIPNIINDFNYFWSSWSAIYLFRL